MRIEDIVNNTGLRKLLKVFDRATDAGGLNEGLGVRGARPQPRLSKSRYIAGLQCPRRLWLGWHDPEPRSEAEPGSILAVGIDVGVAARQIVPGGVLVKEGPEHHAQAVERTQELIADPTVPAIFEAAFAFDNVVIRADILERLPGGMWRLAEVKSTVRVKTEHLDDLAVQAYVIAGSGLTVSEMHLVHVDASYVRGNDGIDWPSYFKREDVTEEILDLLPFVPGCVDEMHAIMTLPEAPAVRPSGHCFSPHPCEFWPRCTADKPVDWIFYIPRLSQVAFAKLDADNIESMRDIPADFPLSPAQQRVVDTMLSGRELMADGLREALVPLEPPASYLDFETFSPILPVYVGTSPNERIPFQWSLHHDRGYGDIRHFEFLAAGDIEPRRKFAEALLHAVENTSGPIVVYSSFEATVLRDLVGCFTDLGPRLFVVIDRIRDLLPIMRKYVSHPEFLGSYSIKAVAPALVPGFTYADLGEVADGDDASMVFHRLVTDRLLPNEDRKRFRHALLTYCGRDTAALMFVHRRLRAFVNLVDEYAGKQSGSRSHLSMPSRRRHAHGLP